MAEEPDQPIHLSADQARGGEIELNTPVRRIVFLVGLIGVMVLGTVLMIASYR